MKKKILSLFIIILNISQIIPYDKDLWAIVINTSNNYDNYRHSTNSLLMYNTLKENGIPDEHIILALAEYHSCDTRNTYPGKVLLSVDGKILESCDGKNINIDYKETDVTNYQLLDILRGRKMNQFNSFRQLNTNKNSKIIVIITSHGGENFIKIRGTMVILSEELNRTLNEMYIKQKYKELVFILDTCEGYSLYDYVNVPNIYFVASALLNQKASSYSYDSDIMGPTVDKFHFLLFNALKDIRNKNNFSVGITDMLIEIKNKKDFLSTDVTISDKIGRNITVGEFFGNLSLDEKNEDMKFIEFNDLNSDINNVFNFNNQLMEKKKNINKEVLNINKYSEESFTLIENNNDEKSKNQIMSLISFGIVFGLTIICSLII